MLRVLIMDYDVNIVGGQLVFLSNALLPAIKSDVLNSLLLIQLYADDNADKFGQYRAWGQHQAEAQVNTKWVNTHAMTFKHKIAPEAEVAVTLLATDYLARLSNRGSLIPSQAMALALNAVMQRAASQKAFFKEVLKINSVQSPLAVDGTSNMIMQVCVVESNASMFSVEINLWVGASLEGNIFTRPIKGEVVIGEVDIAVSRFEFDSVEYKGVRKSVLDSIEKLNANRKNTLKIVDLSVPPSVIIELAALPG